MLAAPSFQSLHHGWWRSLFEDFDLSHCLWLFLMLFKKHPTRETYKRKVSFGWQFECQVHPCRQGMTAAQAALGISHLQSGSRQRWVLALSNLSPFHLFQNWKPWHGAAHIQGGSSLSLTFLEIPSWTHPEVCHHVLLNLVKLTWRLTMTATKYYNLWF